MQKYQDLLQAQLQHDLIGKSQMSKMCSVYSD